MEPKIRVLHVIDHLGAGGAQDLLLEIVKNINRSRFEMEVCCLHGWGAYADEIRDLGVHVYSLSERRLNPFIPFSLWRLLVSNRYDILNSHLSASTLLSGIIGWLAEVPGLVVTIHALKNQSLPWVFPLWGMLSPLFDKFVAEVQLSKEELIESGVPEDKIEYIQIGTDFFNKADIYERKDRERTVREEFNIGEKDPLILNIARLHKHKGHIHLIKAMGDVAQEMPTAKLLIVGDGPMRPTLEGSTAQLGLTQNVIFAGFRRDLMALYSTCDVLVMPSIKEALGITTIQAMACGKPVVACNVGAMSEAIIHSNTGLLVPPKDPSALAQALIRLIKEPLLKRELGLRAKAFVRENFNLEALIHKYEEMYRTLGTGINR